MDGKKPKLRILMFPWLAHGHISPFLELAKRLASRNFEMYICSTPVNIPSIEKKMTRKFSDSIHLVELHLPSLPDLPPRYHTTKNLPPHLNATLKLALDMAKPNFSRILKTVNPDLLIYDVVQPWAPALAHEQSIPAVEFVTAGAAACSFILHLLKYPETEFPYSAIYLRDYEKENLTQFLESSANHSKEGDRSLLCFEKSCNITLIKTFRELEGKYLDYLSVSTEKKIISVGPLVEESRDEDEQSNDVIQWLDKKSQNSTVYVSFGSELFLTKEEMGELAHGLEQSKVNFMWVVRFPEGEKTKAKEALPRGFFEKVGERGKVIEGWAPQRKILEHASVGAFLSHCGWSSVMEAMKSGVPIIAMPMQLDQPFNARLMEEYGVALEVVRDENGRLGRDRVAKVVKEVVEEKGEKLRRKARGLSDRIRMQGDKEIDEVEEELLQLCHTWRSS